jgi:hypothetical protein
VLRNVTEGLGRIRWWGGLGSGGCHDVDWTHVAQVDILWRALVHAVCQPSVPYKAEYVLTAGLSVLDGPDAQKAFQLWTPLTCVLYEL